MLKKIKLDIESVITDLDDFGLPDGEPETNRSSHMGAIRIAEDETVISYKDSDENGAVSCAVAIRGGSVSVRREGAICSVMVFDTDTPFKTVYSIPPYKFDMEIVTKRLDVSFDGGCGKINIVYHMNVGGAKKNAKMKITVREVAVK